MLANTLASGAAFLTALAGLIAVLRTRTEVKKVHTIVNQQSTDQDNRIDQLKKQLVESGIIPDEREKN